MAKEVHDNNSPAIPQPAAPKSEKPIASSWENGAIITIVLIVLILSASQTAAFFGLPVNSAILAYLVLIKGFGYAAAVDATLFLTIRRARLYASHGILLEAKRWRWISLGLTGFTVYCNFKFGYDAGGIRWGDWGAMIALFFQSLVPPSIMFLAAFMTTEGGKKEVARPLSERVAGMVSGTFGVVDAFKQVRDQREAAQAPEKERKAREAWSRQIANPKFAAKKTKERREAFMRQLGIEWEDEDGKVIPGAMEQFATWEKLMVERGIELLSYDAPEQFRGLLAEAKRLGISTAVPDAVKRFQKAEKAEREALTQALLTPAPPNGPINSSPSATSGSLPSTASNTGYTVKDFARLIGKSERTIRNWIHDGTIHPDEVFNGTSGQQLIHPSAHLRLVRDLKQGSQTTATRKGAHPLSGTAPASSANGAVGQKTATN